MQYYGHMDALASSIWTSIASGSELAHARLGMDSSRLNQENGLLEFGNCHNSDVFHGHNCLHACGYESQIFTA